MEYKEILQLDYFGNSVLSYLISVSILLSGLIFHTWISGLTVRLISKLFRRSEHNLNYQEYKTLIFRPINFLIFLIVLLLAFNNLSFPAEWDLAPVEDFGFRMLIVRFYQLLLAIALTRVALKIIVIIGRILQRKAAITVSKQDDQLIPFAVEIVKILVVVITILIILSTIFELNVGSLVAGLGIGGLAIALAAKESLENLFGSFTIFFDKPFSVGDLVKVGDITGEVEKIGFRSTRIRTLEKSYLTIPNKRMIDAELDNLSLRTFRRVKFFIGLVYGTKHTAMKAIVDKISQFLLDHPHTNSDVQVRFTEFGSSSLDIMILYYVDTMDWGSYLQYKEEINYRIMEIVEEEGSDFAFPTQTLHLHNEE